MKNAQREREREGDADIRWPTLAQALGLVVVLPVRGMGPKYQPPNQR